MQKCRVHDNFARIGSKELCVNNCLLIHVNVCKEFSVKSRTVVCEDSMAWFTPRVFSGNYSHNNDVH